MRTKTLLLTAALAAAGIASSMAQAVYSVNAVGYVNTTLKPGYNLVSNPLTATDQTIKALFASLPAGTQVFKYNGTSFTTASKDDFTGEYLPPTAANLTVAPGEGVFVALPAGTPDQTVTFVGEVPQGAASNQTVPAGLSIRSSTVPQTGLVTDLQFPGAPGDQIFKFNSTTQGYTTYSFDDFSGTWLPSVPTINVGEAVFVNKVAAAAWNRNFSVNS